MVSEPVAAALPPRTRFDSQEWLASRQPSARSLWLKRGGAAAVAGMLGCLGWVGFQQMPSRAAASTASEEEFVLAGETAGAPKAEFVAAPQGESVEEADLAVSPFDRAPITRRMAPAVEAVDHSAATQDENPFAAFAPPRQQTAMAPEESPFAAPPSRMAKSRSAGEGVVTLASNETAAPMGEAVGSFEVAGQSEPAVTIVTPEPMPSAEQATPNDDPFAAFSPQGAAPAQQVSSVPGSFGAPAEEAQAEAQWTTAQAAPAMQAVTPVQFEPEPVPLQVPAQFEPEARPIGTSNGFAAEPAPSPGEPKGEAAWPAFEQQPAPIEPAAPARRAKAEPPYSPRVGNAERTSFNVPQPAAGMNDPQDETLHVVQQGETYWSIARQHYGAGRYFQALAEYNKPRISDQQSLKPGMKVLVPSAQTLDTRYGKLMQASGHAKPPAKPQAGLRFNAQGEPYYIVGEGDTLGEIATRYLGKTLRSEEIYRMNQEQLPNPNNLKMGMILVMPADAAETGPANAIPGRR
ncbi:LysM domain/BON superfamily protein [Caulifigura coniformis]|uniref:LysM domain/BON superfamily protein n=1 Tax=Caulifigura coniformis TaxID=2527983 RepID=A0A517SGY9_9PLAN|nr:LysM peptidoglycan-binding domain-containing protein [Caulifigura coniformis]QDT55382.1 LysM domain/BON superfamily protein [Caulifigura coniformis]